VSCKQVSSHLQSLFHHADARLQVTHMNENILQEQRVTTENVSNPAAGDVDLLLY
jgi:hypothetical protein